MSLAPYVRIVARGQGRARPLTLEEAFEAMTLILADKAAPEAVGALLMVLRMRGETPAEIAGFTRALRAFAQAGVAEADLDWPSYAAGRSRGAPLFVLAANLVGQAGYRVHLHGWNAHPSQMVAVADVVDLMGPNVSYDPLQTLCHKAFKILKLRDIFGLRSCFNTVLRMWNPSRAPVSVQGVFHPSYRGLQANAAALLGQRDLTIIKGGGGEFERHPSKDTTLFGLRDGTHIAEHCAPLSDQTRRLHDVDHRVDLCGLWHGAVQDPFAVATVTGTAALALWSLKATPTVTAAQDMAAALWVARHQQESRLA
ncbi:glycosyl transferase family protein [uncultured Tateyamaria sp.]|uniref:glycosyl transferase family protein n=1 Tax=uncultured Tateyamaria sp. TaxID=455651 RepID=UPI002610349B|nr:glycosyl transferase family protein [uncultured Tateyamaria sp.]